MEILFRGLKMSHHVGYLITAVVTGPPGAILLWMSFLFRALVQGLLNQGAPPQVAMIFDTMLSSFFIIGIILIIVGIGFLIAGLVAYRNRLNK